MTTRRTEQKRENRAKLLDAARKVFAEKGFGAATARDIVRETDLATGTFYNYFTDKEDAFRAVMDEFTAMARVGAREERRKPGVDLEERVFNAYCGFFLLVVEDPQMFEIFRKNADTIAMLGAGDLFEDAVRELAEDMRQWVAEGQLPAAVEPWLVPTAHSMAGGGFQVAAHMLEQGASDVEAAARFCTRLLLDGLRRLG